MARNTHVKRFVQVSFKSELFSSDTDLYRKGRIDAYLPSTGDALDPLRPCLIRRGGGGGASSVRFVRRSRATPA